MFYRYFAMMSFLIPAALSAQNAKADSPDFSHLMKKQPAHWWDISYACSELAPEYFERGDQDSLALILQYWEAHTRFYEPIRRIWMLNRIYLNDFDANFFSEAVVEDMYEYQSLVESRTDSTDWYLWSGDSTSAYISATFNRFTKNLAMDLLQYDDLSDDEWLVSLFYSNNFKEFWKTFESGEASQSVLYRRFYRQYKEMTRMAIHYDFFAGYYSPRKSLTVLDPKATVGFDVGLDWDRVLLDFTLLFRFVNPQQPYSVKYMDEIFETQDYFGLYLGVEPAFRLYDFGRCHINLLSGVALDIIEAIPAEKNPYEEESVDLAAANLNLGVGCKFFIKQYSPYYIRCQVRYEYTGYDTDGGTDLSEGEALTFRLGFGLDPDERKYRLQQYFKNAPF